MRAKSHDQRKGQWIINKIRSDPKFPKIDYKKLGLDKGSDVEKRMVELRLWNMENDEFDRLMGDYNE